MSSIRLAVLLAYFESVLCCNPWLLESARLPSDPRLYPSIGNGFIGSIVHSSYLHINGIYNGRNIKSTHARVPNLISFTLGLEPAKHTLDLKSGYFVEEFRHAEAKVSVTSMAHRNRKNLLVTAVRIIRTEKFSSQLEIPLIRMSLNRSQINDLNISQWDVLAGYEVFNATSKEKETAETESPEIFMISTKLPDTLILKPNVTEGMWYFVQAVTVNDSINCWAKILAAAKAIELGYLTYEHEIHWYSLWQNGGIEVQNNCTLARMVRSSQYYIWSSLPPMNEVTDNRPWPFFGLSPGSLCHYDSVENYQGHVFWDQEVWMLPAVLAFEPEMVNLVLSQSRFRRIAAAKQNAMKRGFKGAMFPWESAFSGFETTNWAPAAKREIHVSADISLMIRLHSYATKSKIHTEAYQTALEIAEFWSSRVTFQPDKRQFEIIDVMGPDEHHDHVNNSVYTNEVAKLALALPSLLYKKLMNTTLKPPKSEYLEIAKNLYSPFDNAKMIHPEFDGYNSDIVKQADVTLLIYPLMINMSKDIKQNDLEFYESRTDPSGPAMTWSIYSIGWMDVDNYTKADEMFLRNLNFIKGPFNVWTEYENGRGATNFITGAGGFLQNLLNGYLGLRYREVEMELKPHPIMSKLPFLVHQLKYAGNSFTINIGLNETSITQLTATSHCFLNHQGIIKRVTPGRKYKLLNGHRCFIVCK